MLFMDMWRIPADWFLSVLERGKFLDFHKNICPLLSALIPETEDGFPALGL